MRIIIDGQPLNYTLEGERNLYEILTGVVEWLRPQSVNITQLDLNGKRIDNWERSQYEKVPINDVEELSITTETEGEKEFKEVEILLQYFKLLQSALTEKKVVDLEEILQEYPHVQFALERHLRSAFLTQGSSKFPIEGVPTTETQWNQAVQFTIRIVTLLETLYQEILHPYEECKKLLPILEQTKKDIEQTSVLLQTGRDREAVRNLLTFIEILSKTLRILSRLQLEDPKIMEVTKSISSPLQELNEGFIHRDSVLIGDLLEYEIAPRIADLQDILIKLVSRPSP